MKILNALIIGYREELTLPLLEVLSLSGYKIDCISKGKRLRFHKNINNFYYVKTDQDLLRASYEVSKKHYYDLIALSDDNTIKLILNSNLPIAYKEKLLPVVNRKYFGHLASKIGLSKALKEFKIRTPNFAVINSNSDIFKNLKLIHFPFILKGDYSGGGNQTVEVNNQRDLKKIITEFNYFPALMQKKIEGDLIGIEALFLESKLVHFSYSIVLKTMSNNKFSPSVVREYFQLGILDEEVFQELNSLGKALGINGFVNITCIKSYLDNRHYYFEADVRPTTWLGYTKYFGDNLAIRLKNYLKQRVPLSYPVAIDINYPIKVIMPYPLRLRTFELLTNRYSAWKYIPKNKVIFFLLIKIRILRPIENLLTLRSFRRALFGK
jgi:hypothetical protein